VIARLEGELLLTALAQRVASIELAGSPIRRFNNAVRGFASLPLEVRAA
jgi:cytochrome P450